MAKQLRPRKLFLNLAIATGVLVLVGTLLPFVEAEAWWIRIFDFPRLQILLLAVISLALYAFCCRPTWWGHVLFLSLLVGCLGYQAFKIVPYTPLGPIRVQQSDRQTDTANHLSLVVVNVFQENRQARRCLEMIRQADADLVLAVETDAWWKEQLDILQEAYPYHLHHPLPNTYGLLLYSRLPLHQDQLRFLVQPDVPSVLTQVELPSGALVRFYGLHPRPPAPQESSSSLPRDAELLLVGKEIAASEDPVIVAGDLNDVAWSHTSALFQEISGVLDPRKGRGLYPTFNALYPLFRWPLDHVFLTPHFRLLELNRLPPIGSDHFPIYVRLSYEPEKKNGQPEPEPEAEDHEDAEEKLEKAEEEL